MQAFFICKKICVEVKGTSGPAFPDIELTANEWNAAQSNKENYQLFLVANCKSNAPKIEIITNPYQLLVEGLIEANPTAWRISQIAPIRS